jgi:hypothetical protein
MKSDEPQKPDFVLLGKYSLQDAAKLLERLEQAGIAFRTQPSRPAPQPGPAMTLIISVHSARSNEVDQIQRDLFGESTRRGLPNYESSFFRDRRNV